MSRKFPPALLVLVLGVMLTGNALPSFAAGGSCNSIQVPSGVTSCFYVAASGSDANSGISESTPWRHAPGMPDCSNVCNSVTPAPGEGFILRGGDTYHYSASTSGGTDTPLDGQWTWTWSGASGNPIYIGVDTSWTASGNWTRPVFSNDNPFSTGRPSSCAYDDSTVTVIYLSSQNYLTLDNLEFSGKCWNTNNALQATVDGVAGNQVTISNLYFHGWTYGANSTDDQATMVGGNMPKGNYILITGLVCDGTDSSLSTTPMTGFGQASGFCIGGTGSEIRQSVFRHVSNGMINNFQSLHDNLFEFMSNPVGTVHGNVAETNQGVAATGTLYIYNNIVHDTYEGVTFWPEPVEHNLYIFNNVFYNINNSGNCILLDGQGASGTPVGVYIYNNTFDYPCSVNFFAQHAGVEFNGTGYFENNQIIGYSPAALPSLWLRNGSPTLKVVDNGSEVYQSESVANGQGYLPSNNYAPTSASGATVGTGSSATGQCPVFSSNSALCSGTSGGANVSTGQVAISPTIPIVPRSSGWDVGAYQFGSAAGQPSPPSGLTATVQ